VSVGVGDVPERLAGVEGCFVSNEHLAETLAEGLAQVLTSRARIDGRSAVRDLDERLIAQRIIAVYQRVLAKAVS
jgi:hypothetical protein